MTPRSSIGAILASTLLSTASSTSPACLVRGVGFEWDLTSLSAGTYSVTGADQDKYTATICGSNACGSESHDSSLCHQASDHRPASLMRWSEAVGWTRTATGATATFANGDTCAGSPIVTTMNIVCEDEGDVGLVGVVLNAHCSAVATLRVPEASCKDLYPPRYPPDTICRDIVGSTDCSRNATATGYCDWCSSQIAPSGCYTQAQAFDLQLSYPKFSCSFRYCRDIKDPGQCRLSYEQTDQTNPCKYCTRIAGSTNASLGVGVDPGCLGNNTAVELPSSIWSCTR